jgi:RNA-dependent RNA polymerase
MCIVLNPVLQVAEKLDMFGIPSAFQIRYAGCKGVVSQDPTLGDLDIMEIRPSMKKFESDHKVVEILSYTSPGIKQS